jgi:hypothetical protein
VQDLPPDICLTAIAKFPALQYTDGDRVQPEIVAPVVVHPQIKLTEIALIVEAIHLNQLAKYQLDLEIN